MIFKEHLPRLIELVAGACEGQPGPQQLLLRAACQATDNMEAVGTPLAFAQPLRAAGQVFPVERPVLLCCVLQRIASGG